MGLTAKSSNRLFGHRNSQYIRLYLGRVQQWLLGGLDSRQGFLIHYNYISGVEFPLSHCSLASKICCRLFRLHFSTPWLNHSIK